MRRKSRWHRRDADGDERVENREQRTERCGAERQVAARRSKWPTDEEERRGARRAQLNESGGQESAVRRAQWERDGDGDGDGTNRVESSRVERSRGAESNWRGAQDGDWGTERNGIWNGMETERDGTGGASATTRTRTRSRTKRNSWGCYS